MYEIKNDGTESHTLKYKWEDLENEHKNNDKVLEIDREYVERLK